MKKQLIGFIGQGWIGKHYANDFEARKFPVVRYSLEPEYQKNKEKIKDCDIVFIAVPTPTTPEGFDDSIVRGTIRLVGEGKIAVIKSTVTPGTTEAIQQENPNIFVLNSPEFLTESTAQHDASFPKRNIIGVPGKKPLGMEKAKTVMNILSRAPYTKICSAREAELIKYGRNVLGYFRVIFVNLLYDLTLKLGADWEVIREAMSADPDNSPTYMNPLHKKGRGAGGHCFIKDFATFIDLYETIMGDKEGSAVLRSLEQKNIELLQSTNKDLDLLKEVYGSSLKRK